MQPNRKEEMLAEAPGPSLLDRIAEETARMGARYMPTLTVKQYVDRENMIRELKTMLVEGTDYGTIPGTEKPTLYQAGAQKICAFFGYVPSYAIDVEIEDWDGSQHGGEPLFYYRFLCTLMKDGKPVGQCPGSCNSWESKYRYRWVADAPANLEGVVTRDGSISEPKFAVDKAETSGPYGKPAEYWKQFHDAIMDGTAKTGTRKTKKGTDMAVWEIGGKLYRVSNEAYPDIINSVQKIGAKRSYVGACLSATGASQYFTQDLEDIPPESLGIKTEQRQPSAKETPAPQSNGNSKPDVELTSYLARLKSNAETTKVYKEINDRIAKLSNRETVNEQWARAVSQKDASPAAIVRHMYSVLHGLQPPPPDPEGGQQAPSDANEDFKNL